MPAGNGGCVFLVGAGPGDPGLLTLRAAEVIAAADVLLYDALVADAIVAVAPASCERVFVGKRGGQHTMPQDEIESLMIERARSGNRVVRLKGGDPFVFGRGGEEAESLVAAGIPFEIVPGITSAIAAPAYAGIPVTHRDYASAFTVATGHERPSKAASSLDWEKLADPQRTLLFLMAGESLAVVATQLIENGLAASTPAAVVQDGTLARQKTAVGTLSTIADIAANNHIGSPCVLVVGSVVTLRDRIAWFDRRPLFGKRLLITRAAAQGAEFARCVAGRGGEAILAPTIVIGPPDDGLGAQRAIEELRQYRWIVFTSRNGVDAFFAQLAALHADARLLADLKIAAIGSATAERLMQYGIRADVVPKQFVGEEVARALLAAANRGDRVLVYRAQEARDVLPNTLDAAGLHATVVAAYKTTTAEDSRFAAKLERADAVIFTSSSAVTGFSTLLGGDALAAAALGDKVVACVGPITAQTARNRGLPVAVVADTFTASGVLDALERHFTAPTHP
jgi:uroporphyrinogen III methyltransferase / synthase